MLTFHDVLGKAGITSENVNVMLHAPTDPALRTALPALPAMHPEAMAAHNALHSEKAEASLKQGRPYVAVFLHAGSHADGATMLLEGLHRNRGHRTRSYRDISEEPGIRWLHETYGVEEHFFHEDPRQSHLWFDLERADALRSMEGRLTITARLIHGVYVRLAENMALPILSISESRRFDVEPPSWREMGVSTPFLQALPPAWAARLREWRGVYLITDEADGGRYVGSAYGADNLLGRWKAHAASGTGITAQLRGRDPAAFRFSILERVSPDAPAEDVIRLEQTWMDRLHTRRFGLNLGSAPEPGAMDGISDGP